MSDEFERRLDAAEKRAQARKESADKQKTNERNRDQGQAAEVKATANEWMARIRPAIGHAVSLANQKVTHSQTILSLSDGNSNYFAAATGTNTELPYTEVTAGGSRSAAAPKTQQIAGGSEKVQQSWNTHRLHFAVREDGSVEMTAHNCTVANIPRLTRDQFTDERIKMAIADLVDFLIPE